MIGYHVTTEKKLRRYLATGAILPPVRFWRFRQSAEAWQKKTMRHTILKIETEIAYPLPDHHPPGHAYWTPSVIYHWQRL